MKRWRRGLAWSTSTLVVALMLVIAAWLASNWNDAPPQPIPAALALPNPSLPDARNAYFTLAGLRAAPDRDPSTAGQAQWTLLARAHTATSQRSVPDHDTPPIDTEPALGETLPDFSGLPLMCTSPMDDCVAQWIKAADALRRLRDTLGTAAALGVRDPSLGAALKPLLAPLPDPVKRIKRWMVVEAAFQRGAIEDIERQRVDVSSTFPDLDLAAWLARHHATTRGTG